MFIYFPRQRCEAEVMNSVYLQLSGSQWQNWGESLGQFDILHHHPPRCSFSGQWIISVLYSLRDLGQVLVSLQDWVSPLA